MGLPVATLKKGEGRMLKAGGLWVFDNEIEIDCDSPKDEKFVFKRK